ncbi:MAG: hypothetical protein ACREQ4_08040 [Candidatus Binataceae bacterium]
MTSRVLGVYREAEFSPGKVEADAAILDAVLKELQRGGATVDAIKPERFITGALPDAHLVLVMCQGASALSRLAAIQESGAITINSALAVRNCYRDLLAPGLLRAGVPVPEGALISTAEPFSLKPLRALDLSAPMYVKRGDMHALAPHDVQRVEDLGQLEATLLRFARRSVQRAYVQQAVSGDVVKFYGVSGGDYFSAIPESGTLDETINLKLTRSAATAAAALGLEVWGGDAVVHNGQVKIIDFNDWPSYSRVRDEAARAIARRCELLLRRHLATHHVTV